MSANSSIEWTHHTFNPWWGCVRVSPGCEHCYAETMSSRYGHRVWGPPKTTERRLFGEAHWVDPFKWNESAQREGIRHRVFCASMADVFESHHGVVAARARLWQTIEQTPWLDWLLLTKRPENLVAFLPAAWLDTPQPNVWLGTSVEDPVRASLRIPILRDVPATVRFLSCEPLLDDLGDIDLSDIHWVIVGGESGPGARAMEMEWARGLRVRCSLAGAQFFFKQSGTVLARHLGMAGKGGHDLRGLPSDLHVRDFPTGAPLPEQRQLVRGRETEAVLAG